MLQAQEFQVQQLQVWEHVQVQEPPAIKYANTCLLIERMQKHTLLMESKKLEYMIRRLSNELGQQNRKGQQNVLHQVPNETWFVLGSMHAIVQMFYILDLHGLIFNLTEQVKRLVDQFQRQTLYPMQEEQLSVQVRHAILEV